MSIRDELLALADDEGVIFVDRAVDWARGNPDSSLHKAIEWDDANAAHQHRLWQVRQLIKLHVVSESGEPQVVSLSVDRASGGGYRTIQSVLARSDLAEVMLRDAVAELDRVRKRHAQVERLAKVWSAVDEVRLAVKPLAKTARPEDRPAA